MDNEQFAQFMGAMAAQMAQTNQVLGHLAVSTAQPQPQGASSAIAQAMRSNLKPPPYGEKDKAIDADTWQLQPEQLRLGLDHYVAASAHRRGERR